MIQESIFKLVQKDAKESQSPSGNHVSRIEIDLELVLTDLSAVWTLGSLVPPGKFKFSLELIQD